MKINLGSGIYPENGYINIDIDQSVNPDIVRDLSRGLPFSNDTIQEVRAYHILEHLSPEDFLFNLSEVNRVLISEGVFDIQVPLGITDDPTHKIFFNENSFNVFLDKNSQYYYRRNAAWMLIEKEILHQKYPTLHLKLRKEKKS